MDYFRRLEPTPAALRNGRLTLAIVAAVLAVLVVLTLLGTGFDTQTTAIAVATGVTLVGHVIAYVGQPTLTRYRLGLVVMAVGIVAAFWLLIANPFATPSN